MGIRLRVNDCFCQEFFLRLKKIGYMYPLDANDVVLVGESYIEFFDFIEYANEEIISTPDETLM